VAWLRGDDRVGEARVEYGDIPIAGSTLRLPAAGRATVRPSGVSRVAVSRATVTIRFEYRDAQARP